MIASSVYVQPDESDTATTVEMLLSHKHLALQDPDVLVAALAHYLEKPAIGFSSCLVLGSQERQDICP